MSENSFDIDGVRKKFEDIDGDLNNFIQSIREIKEIRDSVESLPERLKEGEAEFESRTQDLDRMMVSTNNLLMNFEEQAKGIIFDLEKKTDNLTNEAKMSIAELGNIFNQGNDHLKNEYSKQSEGVLKKYNDLKQSLEILKNVVGDQQQSVITLKNDYSAVTAFFDKMEKSITDIRKSIAELQKRPVDSELVTKVKEKKMMERLEKIIDEKNSRLKILSWGHFIVLLTGFLYFLFAFYLD